MKKELLWLREAMKKNRIDAYLIPTTDFHGSEYVNEYFQCREYISGFTGSNGDLLVTMDKAALWTDGRYFIQAREQLEGTSIELMKLGVEGTPMISQYIRDNLTSGSVLGFDGRVVSMSEGISLCEDLESFGISFATEKDLVNEIWTDRPTIKPSSVYPLPKKVVGDSTEEKLTRIRGVMKEKNATHVLITSLEEIAWLLNMRGNDVLHTPVFFAFMLIGLSEALLYIYDDEENVKRIKVNCPDEVQIKEYHSIKNDLIHLKSGCRIIVNPVQANYSLYKQIPKGVEIIKEAGPAEILKAIKNTAEIESTKNAHIKDGVAMVEFLFWLKKNIGKMKISEISASDYLGACRSKKKGFMGTSFDTISGYNENGAIIHYTATEETNKQLEPKGLLLVDSGGQYEDGTTDITRTIVLGHISEKMKECYTAVLRANIDLASATFEKGTTGLELDAIARSPIREIGYDYNHGTGHGVGHILSVHEGPNSISTRGGKTTFAPGMITSDEPGIYLENEFGIRLENEILSVKLKDGKLGFETITLCPFDREAILTEKMTKEELSWLNWYHQVVYEELAPYLSKEISRWLLDQTKPLI